MLDFGPQRLKSGLVANVDIDPGFRAGHAGMSKTRGVSTFETLSVLFPPDPSESRSELMLGDVVNRSIYAQEKENRRDKDKRRKKKRYHPHTQNGKGNSEHRVMRMPS